jgi:hypothetical protein
MSWWPFLLGLVATPIAVHFASVMALAGPDALMTFYPYVLLLQNHLPGVTFNTAMLSQWMMYLQFPLYGLIMTIVLKRKGFLPALGTIIVVHLAGVLGVIALHHGSAG